MTDVVVERDGFKLELTPEGEGTPMLVLGASRFYPHYYPTALRDHFEMVFCDLRQWAPTPVGFEITSITLEPFAGACRK